MQRLSWAPEDTLETTRAGSSGSATVPGGLSLGLVETTGWIRVVVPAKHPEMDCDAREMEHSEKNEEGISLSSVAARQSA